MTLRTVLFKKQPLWRENRVGIRHRLPESVQSWTYEFGSLTQRLRATYGDGVAVRVLLQCWRVPFLSERQLLRLPEHRLCLTREVLLHINETPLILARTILPIETLHIAHRSLTCLGSRPLGEVIFAYRQLERVAMDVCLTAPTIWTESALNCAAIQQPIYGRRTVYAIKHKQMLVSEFFLPTILD